MQFIKTKVEEFLKIHPDSRNFLQNYIKKNKEVINAVQDDYKNRKHYSDISHFFHVKTIISTVFVH